jgi:hypothetical protein
MGFVKVHTSVPQRPSSRQIDPWSRLVLSEVIHGLRQQAKNKSKLKLTDAQKAAVAEIQGKPRAFGVVVKVRVKPGEAHDGIRRQWSSD